MIPSTAKDGEHAAAPLMRKLPENVDDEKPDFALLCLPTPLGVGVLSKSWMICSSDIISLVSDLVVASFDDVI